jgi:hypothetical protein
MPQHTFLAKIFILRKMQVSFVYHICLGPFNLGASLQVSSVLTGLHQPQHLVPNKSRAKNDPAFIIFTRPVEFALHVALGHDGNIVRTLDVLSTISQSRKNSFTVL